MASWLDARAHEGLWLVRMEDLDPPREIAGAAADILATLAAFGLESDEPVVYQSTRGDAYQTALDRLLGTGQVFGCACSRRELDLAGVSAEADAVSGSARASVYPGTCRTGTSGRAARAWRLRVPAPDAPDAIIKFIDRACGRFEQDLAREVGDFVLKRADGYWAYQLAVVVDDAAQGITDIVRGADLLDNTPRQIYLQTLLGLPTPRYMHVPVVRNRCGDKLSKQTGAQALDRHNARAELERAWQHLGVAPLGGDTRDSFLRAAVEAWRERWLAPANEPQTSERSTVKEARHE